MSAIITENLEDITQRTFMSLSQKSSPDTYYLFLGKATPFTTGTSGGSDTSPSTPADSVSREFYNWDSMLGAKKITFNRYCICTHKKKLVKQYSV